MNAFSVFATLSLFDFASEPLGKIEGKMKKLGQTSGSLGRFFGQVTVKMMPIAATAGAVAFALGVSISAAAGFEDKMAEVGAVSRASAVEMQQLESTARDLGATTRYSASEVGEAEKYLAMAAEKLVPGEDDLGEFHLKYISTAIISTPSININQAKLEAKSMLELVSDMYDLTMEVMLSSGKKMGKSVEKIYSMEDRTDLLEREISSFLVKVSRENLSKDQSNESSVLLQKVNDLESIADQCESLTILLRRKYDKNLDISEKGVEELKEIAGKVREFLDLILKHAMDRNLNIMPEAEVLENTIDDMRRKLRKEHIKRLNSQKCSVDSGLIFIDMLSSFEKIGDHAYNIAEGISGLRNP